MSADGPQVDDNVILKADLGENGGPVEFGSLREAKEWIDKEIQQWERFFNETQYANAFPSLMDRQLRLPQEIKKSLEGRLLLGRYDQSAAFHEVEELFERYAEFDSVCSTSPVGAAILKMRRDGGHPLLGVGGLASILGIPPLEALTSKKLNHSHLHFVLAGYGLGRSINVVRRSELPEHKFRMDEQFTRLEGIVENARQNKKEFDDVLMGAKTESKQAIASARQEWDSLRAAFEQELHLRAPATYWRERASSTRDAAGLSLVAFSLLAAAFIAAIVLFGPIFLQDLATTGDTTYFATLALVSLPALTALWVLRHVARLFVTNLERSSDARFRETMTTTFLALTKDGTVEASAEERLLILEALFRSPTPAQADDSHWGGLSELLTKRKSET